MLHDAHVSEYVEVLFSDFSDYFKDVHGYRPRHHVDRTPAGLMAAWASLELDAVQIEAEEAQAEQEAIASVEATIETYLVIGASSRATAIAWLDEAYGTGGDLDYLCYHLGLPYGYFTQAAQAA